MKKVKCFFALVCMAVTAVCAEVTVGANLEFSTDVFDVYRTKKADDVSAAAFTAFDLGDTQLFIRMETDRFGAKITLKPYHEPVQGNQLSKWLYAWFDDTYAWVKPLYFVKPIPIHLKIQMGEFRTRRMKLFDTLLDDWKYGYLWFDAVGGTAPSLSAFRHVESDVMEHLILDLRIGPVTLEYSPIGLAELNPGDKNGTLRGGMIEFIKNVGAYGGQGDEHTKKFASRFRLSTEPLLNGLLELSADYAIAYKWGSGNPDNNGNVVNNLNNPAKTQMIHRYSFFAHSELPWYGIGLLLGYSGSVNVYDEDWGNDGHANVATDIMHAVELRADFRDVYPNLLIETHNLFGFAKDVGKQIVKPTAPGAPVTYKDQPFNEYFTAWNEAAVSYRFTEILMFIGEVSNKYVKFSGQDANKNSQYKCENEFSIKPLVRVYMKPNAYIQTGLQFIWNNTWNQSDEKDWTWHFKMPLAVNVKF